MTDPVATARALLEEEERVVLVRLGRIRGALAALRADALAVLSSPPVAFTVDIAAEDARGPCPTRSDVPRQWSPESSTYRPSEKTVQRVLALLRYGPLSADQAAKELGVSRPTMTSVFATLLQRQQIERRRDGRRWVCSLVEGCPSSPTASASETRTAPTTTAASIGGPR
jgi:biotin operon repressor